MTLEYGLGKSAKFALFLIIFFTFSCTPLCNQWKLALIKADCPPACYTKLYLPANNTFNGLEAVLMSIDGDWHFYLHALTLLFPSIAADDEHTEVILTIEETTYAYTADRLQGGQCLLLPDEANQLIICSLLEKTEVLVTSGRYQATLTPENFAKTYAIALSEDKIPRCGVFR